MSLPTWLPDWLTPALELAPMQQFGLAFLLGSFTVATWSDLKRLSAQREFVEIWLLFALAMLGHDAWRAHGDDVSGLRVGVKWGLIGTVAAAGRRALPPGSGGRGGVGGVPSTLRRSGSIGPAAAHAVVAPAMAAAAEPIAPPATPPPTAVPTPTPTG
jgi:hypothetical protein